MVDFPVRPCTNFVLVVTDRLQQRRQGPIAQYASEFTELLSVGCSRTHLIIVVLIYGTTERLNERCGRCCRLIDYDIELTGLTAEHHFERQNVAMWIEDAIAGVLSENDGTTPAANPLGAVDRRFFTDTLYLPNGMRSLFPPAPTAVGGGNYWTPIHRLMNALGSNRNWANFRIVGLRLNCLKELVC